ncbi:MAG TPA: nucleotidyltransferase family protein [Candidatus Nanoarchaeia archaeon]|nr:nucleotidyltransferase family protein [Candidatus Nanoarchaeia archaeon]
MSYTEIKKRNEKTYYYRVISIRNKEEIKKKRIYLGADISKEILNEKETEADKQFTDNKKEKILEKIKAKIIPILKKNKVKKAGIFGSYARGEQTKNSDVDIIIELPKNIGFGFVGIAYQLEEELGKKVDLITYKSLHPLLKKRILSEEIEIL